MRTFKFFVAVVAFMVLTVLVYSPRGLAQQSKVSKKDILIVQGRLLTGAPSKPCEGAEVMAHNIENNNPTLQAGEGGVVINPKDKVDSKGKFKLKIPRSFIEGGLFTLTYSHCGRSNWMIMPVRTPDKKLVTYKMPKSGIHLNVGDITIK